MREPLVYTTAQHTVQKTFRLGQVKEEKKDQKETHNINKHFTINKKEKKKRNIFVNKKNKIYKSN